MFENINLEDYTGIIRMSAAHSMIISHLPSKVGMEGLSEHLNSDNNQTDVEKFGLWDIASPNYNTFYPDATPEDFKPKDEEFIEPVFRLLSETIVMKGYPIDFSTPGVLKKSKNMLLGQTINIDHEVAVGNAIGSVSKVTWQESYKTKSGIIVPAGINGVLKIDGKSNPRIARGIQMEPPSIHSNSVTVRFKWEPSHSYENKYEFWDNVGSYHKDGTLVRLKVVDIISYSETSLVSHGADPYAQKINDDNEINNPSYASKQYSFSKDSEKNTYKAFVDVDFKTSLTANHTTTPPKNNNNKKDNKGENDMEEFFEQIADKFSLTIDKESKPEDVLKLLGAKFTDLETKFNTASTDLTKVTGEKNDLETKFNNLETEKEGLETKIESFKAIEDAQKAEALRLYKLTVDEGKEPDASMVKLIEEADIDGSQAFITKFKGEVEAKFQPSCKKCGSTDVSMASAKDGEDDKGKGAETKTFNDSFDIANNYKAKKRKRSN